VCTALPGTRPQIYTGMGDQYGRPGAVFLGPFVGLDLNLRPFVYIAVIVLTRT